VGWRLSEKVLSARYILFYIANMKKRGLEQKSERDGQLRWRGRLWLEGEEGTFLGYGRVVLLERIRDLGSIAKAARSMEMSYKHAWDLLASMNRQARCRLVETSRGGNKGGGARLTLAGERAIVLFRECHDRFQEMLQKVSAELRHDGQD
jgi:molybdate transport system regulatory protein